MKPKKLDAAPILQKLAEMRKSIPILDQTPSTPRGTDGRLTLPDGSLPRTEEEFEWAALADGLESLANDLNAAIERKHAEIMETALRVYYTAEELSRDPAHADLIPHVERMREAYEKEHGKPIPPKPKG
jgi:hypothetical protein